MIRMEIKSSEITEIRTSQAFIILSINIQQASLRLNNRDEQSTIIVVAPGAGYGVL